MYTFDTIEIPLPQQEHPVRPKQNPTGTIIISSLLVFWLATFAVAGKNIPDWVTWVLLVIYAALGAVLGNLLYQQYYARKLVKYEKTRLQQNFLSQQSLQGWKYSEVLLEYYMRKGMDDDTISIMFDKEGKEWKVIDLYKAEDTLKLFLRTTL